MAYVYILQSISKSTYYIGSTKDLDTRIRLHNSGRGGQYTKSHGPWRLICFRKAITIETARELEKKVKSFKGGNAFKRIINGDVAEWSKAPHC